MIHGIEGVGKLAFGRVSGLVVRMKPNRYPTPGEIGGTLIRRMIALMKASGQVLPLDSHILIAASGGADSTALAILMARYGRKFAPSTRISLLHINHGWRGEASDGDERFVVRLAKRLEVPILIERLERRGSGPGIPPGHSWEEAARLARQAIFVRMSGTILTAHHADDLAETALWRLFTGADETHGGGILIRTASELRPLLTVRKLELLAFLKEERQSFRTDATNKEQRFLRSKMRARLMPEIERLFPRSIEHLTRRALALQASAASQTEGLTAPISSLLRVAEIRPRRAHFQSLKADARKELHLPGGWRLKGTGPDRWILEKIL